MKHTIGKIAGLACAAVLATAAATAGDLVILTTNDTHSNIDPGADGAGGMLQRKAIVDSVRAAERNVILVDAGDMVQGSLYFKFWRGDVEYPLADLMGYDIRILGNHEFDNGLEEMARQWARVKADRLSANYDFSATPLKGLFKPYVIKKVQGRRIGFMGINVDPESLIAKENSAGVVFSDPIETANRLAAELKHDKKCDLVVAVTHIGYADTPGESDTDLARASRDIDIIIGGHSHTLVDPEHPEKNPHLIPNAEGRPVLVTQTGRYGRYMGYIKVDLDDLRKETPADYDYELIPVTDRFGAAQLDADMDALLRPYRHKVDSINNRVIAWSGQEMRNRRNGAYANFTADFGLWYGRLVADSLRAAGADMPQVDFAVMNVGGIRQNMAEGPITEGQVLSTFPFSNRMVIMREKGSDIVDALQAFAPKGGEAVSANVRAVTGEDGLIRQLYIDGRPVDPDKEYVMATIDYVAAGNDHMTAFARGAELWRDDKEMSAAMMRYLTGFGKEGMPVTADPNGRFVPYTPLEGD